MFHCCVKNETFFKKSDFQFFQNLHMESSKYWKSFSGQRGGYPEGSQNVTNVLDRTDNVSSWSQFNDCHATIFVGSFRTVNSHFLLGSLVLNTPPPPFERVVVSLINDKETRSKGFNDTTTVNRKPIVNRKPFGTGQHLGPSWNLYMYSPSFFHRNSRS